MDCGIGVEEVVVNADRVEVNWLDSKAEIGTVDEFDAHG